MEHRIGASVGTHFNHHPRLGFGLLDLQVSHSETARKKEETLAEENLLFGPSLDPEIRVSCRRSSTYHRYFFFLVWSIFSSLETCYFGLWFIAVDLHNIIWLYTRCLFVATCA